jgi:hypothetical protein
MPLFCGVRDDASAACWNLFGPAPAQPPAGHYLDVGIGESHGCGLLDDHTLRCWGCEGPPGEVSAPGPDGGFGSCPINYGQGVPPEGEYDALSVDSLSGCAIERGSGALVCWGNAFGHEGGASNAIILRGGPFVDVLAGRNTGCGLEPDGRIECFGFWDWEPRGTDFVTLAGHGGEFCGVRGDGRIECSSLTPP